MKTKPDSMVEKLKEFIRQPYAWPGGYPLFLITADGGTLCKNCGKRHAKTLISETVFAANTGWHIKAVDVNWEDSGLTCDNCEKPIESAYGENNETA